MLFFALRKCENQLKISLITIKQAAKNEIIICFYNSIIFFALGTRNVEN